MTGDSELIESIGAHFLATMAPITPVLYEEHKLAGCCRACIDAAPERSENLSLETI